MVVEIEPFRLAIHITIVGNGGVCRSEVDAERNVVELALYPGIVVWQDMVILLCGIPDEKESAHFAHSLYLNATERLVSLINLILVALVGCAIV